MLIPILALLALFLFWVMLYDGTHFQVTEQTIEDKRIKKPLRVVFVTDLHNKSYGKDNRVLLEAIDSCQPDYVLVGGDSIVGVKGHSMKRGLSFIKELSERYPVLLANGNHEQRIKLYPGQYPGMAEAYFKAVSGLDSVTLLENDKTMLEDYGVCVYGLELAKKYYIRGKFVPMEDGYMTETLDKPDASQFTLLLAHNPEYFENYVAWGADYTLSGHTHGGVARIPFWNRGVISPSLKLFPKYHGGTYRDDATGRSMYLSRGLGVHTIPVRVFNPGELVAVNICPITEESKETYGN